MVYTLVSRVLRDFEGELLASRKAKSIVCFTIRTVAS
jgi:hypothetical protein